MSVLALRVHRPIDGSSPCQFSHPPGFPGTGRGKPPGDPVHSGLPPGLVLLSAARLSALRGRRSATCRRRLPVRLAALNENFTPGRRRRTPGDLLWGRGRSARRRSRSVPRCPRRRCASGGGRRRPSPPAWAALWRRSGNPSWRRRVPPLSAAPRVDRVERPYCHLRSDQDTENPLSQACPPNSSAAWQDPAEPVYPADRTRGHRRPPIPYTLAAPPGTQGRAAAPRRRQR